MKFSIVVPVYNVEEYILKCLNSIYDQTYKNYEVIIINDGSLDNSEAIIKKFIKNKSNFKYYKKENGGLSDARNYGVNFITGDYMLFLDSDDYIRPELLEKIEKVIEKKKYDLVKFGVTDVINKEEIKHYEKITTSKEVDLKDIINFDYFEPAWSYCYNTKFYKRYNFHFEKDRYHEDFGLIPLVLINAKKVYYLDFLGYCYVHRENSITSDNSKNEKKAYDTLYFSLKNIKYILDCNMSEDSKRILINYYANGAIIKLKIIDNKKDYIKELRINKVYKYLINRTLKQKIKKIICFVSYDIYVYLFMR